MIRYLILKQLEREERSLGESVDYVRHILRSSLPAFVKFALFTPLAQHRRKLPPAPYRVARIVATQDEDCGTCVQIEVNLARKDGVPADLIRAVLNRRLDDLTPELADVYCFTKAVVEASGEEEELRQRIRERYGEEGLVELALGMAAARVFPVTKRALGFATSCALVEVKI
jgi:alkylhydroperoxidase family enzyme